MITFFDYEKLLKEADGNAIRMLEVLRFKVHPEWARSSKDMVLVAKAKRIVGKSFAINLEALIKDLGTDPLYKQQYLLLASKRDFTLYRQHRELGLPLSYFPDLDLNKIRSNPLLVVRNNNLYFKYEE